MNTWRRAGALALIAALFCVAARAADVTDQLMEDLVGPSDDLLASLATQAALGDTETRAEAIWALARYDHERCAAPLLGLMAAAPAEVRPHVAMGLGWLGKKAQKTAPALAAYLDKDQSPLFASAAVWALGRMGDPSVASRIQPFAKSDRELLRFLAEEALQALQGKEALPAKPLYRPLKGATILWVGIVYNGKGGPDSIAYKFDEALRGEDMRYEVIGLGPFNPAMGYLGGMSRAEEERCSRLLDFKDGVPQADVVMLPFMFPYELSLRLRWELWNYVRRGGKLLIGADVFKKLDVNALNGRGTYTKLHTRWHKTLFDSALPTSIAPADLPFLDGAAPASSRFLFGVQPLQRGLTLMLGTGAGTAVELDTLINTEHVGYFVAGYNEVFGAEQAPDAVLWHQILKWTLEGPEAFVATAALDIQPAFKSGESTDVSLTLKNYLAESPDLHAAVALVSPEGRSLASGTQDVTVAKGTRRTVKVPLALPLETCAGECRLRATITDRKERTYSELAVRASVEPAFTTALRGPAELKPPGETMQMTATVEKKRGKPLAQASVIGALADSRGQPLYRQVQTADFAETGSRDFSFALKPDDLPAGLYYWLLEVRHEDRVLHRASVPVVRMEPCTLRKELIVSTWGFGYVPGGKELESLKSIGMTAFNLPVTSGLWTWSIYTPAFYPFGQWPAQILAGEVGTDWRRLGEDLRAQPLYTFADTTEESDLAIGNNVFQRGDVEKEGLEQYRLHLKQKYGTLSALNAAWKSDFADWSEIRLLGAVALNKDDVSYTRRMGGGGGDMVVVPEKLDPAKGIVSLQPYLDQNAWRWIYIWDILEIRDFAFHQTDPYHLLSPGGAMGLIGPFDIPHFRLYGGNSLSTLGLRATIGRETYGLKPHTVLVGVGGTEEENSKIFWSGLAAGGRLFTTYSDGSGLGQYILKGDRTLNEVGQGLGRVLARILPWQEAFLACHNAVDRNTLFLSSGNPWDGDLSAELYDALLGSGTLVDYSTDPAGRKVIFCRSGGATAESRQALKAFVDRGGALVLLLGAAPELLAEFGIAAETEPPSKSFVGEVTFSGQAPLDGVKGSFASTGRIRPRPAGAGWTTPGRYADQDIPAVLQRTVGQGQIWFLNFQYAYDSTLDMKSEATSINESNEAIRSKLGDLLQQRYAPAGKIRPEAEAFRRVIAAVAARAGVPGAYQTIDHDGGSIPYVETQLVETQDRSQQYLIAYSDYRLPQGLRSAAGEMRVKLPGVRAIHDVCNEEDIPLQDGQFAFEFDPGRGTLFSLLTEDPGKLVLTPECTEFGPGGPVRVGVQVTTADGKPAACEHAFNLHVYDKNGNEIAGLSQHLSLRGKGIVTLFPSWSDPNGAWRIVMHDLTTGRRAEAAVRKDDTLAAPAARASLAAFAIAPPDVTVSVEPLPELTGTANFVSLSAALHAANGKGMKLRVRLRIPDTCLVSSAREQEVMLTPQKPEARVSWDLFLSREEALALYYSAKPAGFRTGMRPEAKRYPHTVMPALEVEVLEGGDVAFASAGTSTSLPGRSFAVTVPMPLMPFVARPPHVGRLAAEPVTASVNNRWARPVAGRIRLTSPTQDVLVPAAVDFSAAPGTEQVVPLAPKLARDTGLNLGLVDLPIEIAAAGKSYRAGAVQMEIAEQRAWLVTKGSYQEAQLQNLPFGNGGEPTDRKAWRAVQADAALPGGLMLGKAGDLAYLFTRILSPEERPIGFRTVLVGADARIWINGEEAYRSAGQTDAKPGTDIGEDLLRDLGASLKKGWNTCVVELHQTSRRYLDPPLAIVDRNGKCLRDLAFDCDGTKP